MKQRFLVTGMSCAACSAHVEKAVGKLDGVSSVAVNLMGGTMQVEFAAPATTETIIRLWNRPVTAPLFQRPRAGQPPPLPKQIQSKRN